MFTLLVAEQEKLSFWQQLLGSNVWLEEHHTMDIPWRLIRAVPNRNGLDWNKIERYAGRHRARVVSSVEYRPPSDSCVEIARLYEFKRILAAKAICSVLKERVESESVGVIDPAARCLSAVEILLEQAKCVMVYTKQPHRYEWFARRMLQQKGAAVLMCSNPVVMKDCRMVLLGGACEDWQKWAPDGSAVFSAVGEIPSEGHLLVSGFEPQCPAALRRQIPKGVPPEDICAALYQLAARRELAELSVKLCRVNGVGMDLTQLERMLCKVVENPEKQGVSALDIK